MRKFKYISLIASSALLFSACGGGSNGSNTASNNKTVIKGKVVDYPVQGAKVCLDVNQNEICDEGEPTAKELTKNDGSFVLEVKKDIDKKGNIISIGGKDTVTKKDIKVVLKTNIEDYKTYNNVNINPLTTNVAQLVEEGNTLSEAKKEVKEFFDLKSFDSINDVSDKSLDKLNKIHVAMTSGNYKDNNTDNGYKKIAKLTTKEDRKTHVTEAKEDVAKFFESNVYSQEVKEVYFDANNNGIKDEGEKTVKTNKSVFDSSMFKDLSPTSTGGTHSYFVFRSDNGLSLTFMDTQKDKYFKNGLFITPITTFIATTANRLVNSGDITGVGMANFMQKISTVLGLSEEELYANANTNKKVKEVSDKLVDGLKEKNASYHDLAKALENEPQSIEDLLNNIVVVEKLQFTKASLDVQINTSGNREDGKTYVISVSSETKDEYKFFKDEDVSKINKLRIKSGNEKELFKFYEFYQEEKDKDTLESTGKSVKYLDIKLDVSKQEQLKVDDTYTLVVETLDKNDKVNGEITLNIKVVLAKIVTQDVEVDISKAFPDSYSKGRKVKTTGEPILFNLEKDASPYYPERLDVIEKSAADLENIIFAMEENDFYKLARVKDGYSGDKYVIVLKDGKTPKETEVLNLSAKVLYKDGDNTKENTSEFKLTIKNPSNFNFEQLKEKTKNSEASEREIVGKNTSVEAIPEPENPELQDYTYDVSHKIYTSNSDFYVEANSLVKKEGNGEGNISFEIVSGNDEKYFTSIEKDWSDAIKITIDTSKNIPTGDYTLGIKAKKGDYESNEANLMFTINEVEVPTVITEIKTISLSKKGDTKRDTSESDDTKITPLFTFVDAESKYYEDRISLIQKIDNSIALNGNEHKNIEYILVGNSNNYEIKTFYNWAPYYGIFLKEVGSLEPEDLVVKLKVKGKELESEQVTVRITD